ncbi:MAG TPA: family 78 glycoside hydrolase catalytic domain [Phycisphaerae bacterium]|nr:family 78 glycoside hydrolase catalytic domain [Phycisphaerae bacterium]
MALIGMFVVAAGMAFGDVRPTQLTCEYLVNPLGIDTPAPRLAWILESDERAQVQTARQILVASSVDKLKADEGDLWDSRKVDSNQSIHVVYAGRPPASGRRVFWKVRAWDKAGKPSAWSEPAWWEMGLLQPVDWKARWICSDKPLPETPEAFYQDDPAPMFRREFVVGGKIDRARAYVSGLGYYELRLNGRKVGDCVLDPGWTSYARRVLYSTHDVTDLLKEGSNAAGIIVGNGWYNPLPLRMWGWLNLRDHLTIGKPRVICQIGIEYADGSRETIATSPDWKVGDSPILRNDVYLGEVYDARKEQTGWDRAGFDDAGWPRAVAAGESVGPLHAQMQPPIRVTRVLEPVSSRQLKCGARIIDFGQNFAGVARLRVKGKAGGRVNLRYGELLNPDGTLNGLTAVAGQIKKAGVGGPGAPDVAWQQDSYVLKGQGEEEFTPRFTFHGFRYVEVTGLGEEAELLSLEGLRMNSDVQPAGSFSCSNEMFNRIQRMCEWTLLSNLFSVQSDCPQREKFGYGGDLVAASEFGMLNFDMAAFYAKVARDFADAVRDNGGLTETAPFVGISDGGLVKGVGPIGWGTAHPMIVWQLYQYYGDRRLMEEHYEIAKQWVEFLRTHAKDHIIDKCIGDHESLADKPTALTSTAFYWYNASLVARMAGRLDKADEQRRYAQLADTIRDAFNGRFLKAETGWYDIGSQATQAFALYFGLAPADATEKVLGLLVDDVLDRHRGHLTTGIFGTKYMLNALTDAGRADVAYAIVNQKDFPGWGHMLERGATTLWEHWEYSDNVFSHNHPMFGSVSEWFFKALAGINIADHAVGGDKLVIRPQPVAGLDWVKGEYRSIGGTIASRWRIEDQTFHLDVQVPVGSTAEVHLPTADPARVYESSRPADRVPELTRLSNETAVVVYRIGSGTYNFQVHGFRREQR